MPDALCVVCRRRAPKWGAVCDADQETITKQLADLPRKMYLLPLLVVPGQAQADERVTRSRPEAPLPVRVDALSLTGPGSEYVEGDLRPVVRAWSTERVAAVSWVVSTGQMQVVEQTIVDWHQEYVRGTDGVVLARSDDDQIGLLPPAEWLDSWVRNWRKHFGHGVPPRTHTSGQGWPKTEAAAREEMWRSMVAADADRSPAAAAAVDEWRRYAADTVLGLNTKDRGKDPLREEWEIRFGLPDRFPSAFADVAYLALWLPTACEQDIGIAPFAAELRALTAELARVLGEQPDDEWLGRCPAAITETVDDPDHPDGARARTRPCGGGLWQEPFAKQIQCPRCHSTWGPDTVQLLYLAREIRRVWPVDRRKRYTLADIRWLESESRMPPCPACGKPTAVGWREVTTPGDTQPFWRPNVARCPDGCPEAERAL